MALPSLCGGKPREDAIAGLFLVKLGFRGASILILQERVKVLSDARQRYAEQERTMNDIRADFSVHREALIRDAKVLLADIQVFLRDVADEAGEEAGQARVELGSRLQALQARLDTLRQTGRDRISQLADTTDHYVREHPWQCLGTVAAIGAATGAIVALAASRR